VSSIGLARLDRDDLFNHFCWFVRCSSDGPKVSPEWFLIHGCSLGTSNSLRVVSVSSAMEASFSLSQCILCIRIHVIEYHSGPIIDIPFITKRGWSVLYRTSTSKGKNVSRGHEVGAKRTICNGSACVYRRLSLARDRRARNFPDRKA
jgi:hypothetical protein